MQNRVCSAGLLAAGLLSLAMGCAKGREIAEGDVFLLTPAVDAGAPAPDASAEPPEAPPATPALPAPGPPAPEPSSETATSSAGAEENTPRPGAASTAVQVDAGSEDEGGDAGITPGAEADAASDASAPADVVDAG